MVDRSTTGGNIVQFRCVGSHYQPSEAVKVTFYYSTTFTANSKDWIGLFPAPIAAVATNLVAKEPLVSVSVGNTARHQFCDGGQWKSGSVQLECPEVSGGEYRFWYVSYKTGEVMSASNSFTVSSNGGMEDCHSLTVESLGVLNAAVGSGGCNSINNMAEKSSEPERRMPNSDSSSSSVSVSSSALDSSFILISERGSCEVPGSEFIMTSLDEGELVPEKAVYEEKKEDIKKEVIPPVSNALTRESMTANGDPSISGYIFCSDPTKVENSPPVSASATTSPSHVEPEFKAASSTSDVALSTPPVLPTTSSSPLMTSSSSAAPLTFPVAPTLTSFEDEGEVNMSASTVIVEKFVTQKEARMLKNSNKELRQKVNKLSEILNDKKREIEVLEDTLKEVQESLSQISELKGSFDAERLAYRKEISSLEKRLSEESGKVRGWQKELHATLQKHEEDKKKFEEHNKRLSSERDALSKKLKQVTEEKKTIFERSSKLLSQLQDSETKRALEKSEKQVLQVKIDYLSSELGKQKQAQQHQQQQQQQSKRIVTDSSDSHTISTGIQDKQHNELQKKKKAAHHQLGSAAKSGHKEQSDSRVYPLDYYRQHHQQQHQSNKSQPAATSASSTSRPYHYSKANEPHLRENITFTSTSTRKPAQLGHEQGGGEDLLTLQVSTSSKPREAEAARHRHSSRDRSAGEDDEDSLSEERLEEIASQLKGGSGGMAEGVRLVDCPICGKTLHSRENDYGVLLHVEHCIELSEQRSE